MVKQQFRETDLGRKIVGISFEPTSADDLRQWSHMEVRRGAFYEEGVGKLFEPATDGPLDKRLGVSKEPAECLTCGHTQKECVGHFGYVDLQLPVFHVGYFRILVQTLQCICKGCSSILLDDQKKATYQATLNRPGITYLKKKSIHKNIVASCKKLTKGICHKCGTKNGVVKKAMGAPLKIVHVIEMVSREELGHELLTQSKDLETLIGKCKQELLSPLDVLNIVDNIPQDEVPLLFARPTYSHPREFLVRRIPVPPVCIRPSIVSDSKSTEDDLTSRVIEIIQLNNAIVMHSKEGAFMPKVVELWDTLQIQCALFINSELGGIPTNMKPKKFQRSFAQRLKGKQGRFRGNLSGKRVDFSGRTVISPDPNLKINQVGVPIHVAKILTFPERVTEHNKKEIQAAVMRGAHEHPGASYIINRNANDNQSNKTFLGVLSGERRKAIASKLRLGDTVERHLRDGDVVLFNRQPSLHKISIMAHRAKVFPGRTFRFNECVCNPYNADFDGDEMNLHLPQTEEARAEALSLMGVSSNLITPRSGEPLVAAIQDFITAGYLISSRDRFFTRQQAAQLIGSIIDASVKPIRVDLPPPALLKPKTLWTGKQIFSLIIRPNKQSPIKLNMRARAKVYDKDEDLSPKDAFVVIRNGELMCGVVEKSTLGGGSKNNIFFRILKEFGEVPAITSMWRLARLAPAFLSNHGFSIGIGDVTPGPGLLREKEKLLQDGYSACQDLIGQFENGMLKARAGQTEEETLEALILNKLSNIREAAGKVCHQELSPYNSPLIMALCGSKGSNINISQMIASVGQQTISGKRAPDGFEERSLPHFAYLEKTPEAKGFVEDSFYSGLTPTEFFFHTMAGREGLVDTAVKTAETGYMQRRLVKCLEDLCAHYDDTIRSSAMEVVQFRFGDDGLDPACMEGDGIVFNKHALLAHCRAVYHSSSLEDKLPPEDMETMISSMLEEKLADVDESFRTEMREFLAEQVAASVKFFAAKGSCSQHTEESKEAKKCPSCQKLVKLKNFLIKTFCLSAKEVREFLEAGRLRWKKAVVEPGTAVGAVGATSIGEPSTQMTLKTFHFAGVASMSITRGVPRIKEIINAVKNISTPVIEAPMMDGEGESVARRVKGRVEKTRLGEIAEYIEDVYLTDRTFLLVKISLQRIHLLHLEVNAYTIAKSIESAKLPVSLKPGDTEVIRKNMILVEIPSTSKFTMYHSIQQLKFALEFVVIKGQPTVNRCLMEADEKSGEKFKLMVEGTDFLSVLATPGVDFRRAHFNNALEVARVLGIEAARTCIIQEILDTMAHHGIGLDRRHVMLLADLMTYRGEVLGITRNGLAKMKESVLLLASFERTIDHLFEASFYGQADLVNGVSDSIIMGVPMPVGTGLFHLLHKNKTPELTQRTPMFQQYNLPL